MVLQTEKLKSIYFLPYYFRSYDFFLDYKLSLRINNTIDINDIYILLSYHIYRLTMNMLLLRLWLLLLWKAILLHKSLDFLSMLDVGLILLIVLIIILRYLLFLWFLKKLLYLQSSLFTLRIHPEMKLILI